MSWDVWLEIDTGGRDPAAVTEGHNYTYNVSLMLQEAGLTVGALDGVLAGTARGILDAAIEKMKADPNKYREMNPKNGWGHYEGALHWLEKIRGDCMRHPKATVRVG